MARIPEELTIVLQTAIILQIELDIDKESIFARIPHFRMRKSHDYKFDDEEIKGDKNDTSINSK